MSIGIMSSKSLVRLIEVQGDSATRNEKEKNTRVSAVSFHHAETTWGSIKQP